MIEERVFDLVAVRSEESREIGKTSDAIVDIAGFEKGEHCFRCSRRGCLIAVNHGVDGKTFQFFLPPTKTVTLAGTSIFPEAKKSFSIQLHCDM
jgi:hypothetical protein